MTLRELGAGTKDWFSTAYEAVTTRNPLDWPISVVFGAAVPVLMIVLFEIAFRRYQKTQPDFEQLRRNIEQRRQDFKQLAADQAALDDAASKFCPILTRRLTKLERLK